MHFLTNLMAESATNIRFDYLPSEREKAWGLWVTGTGMRIAPPGKPYQTYEKNAPFQWSKDRKGRVLNDFGFVYLTEGRGQYWAIPGKPQLVRAGIVMVILPGIWHNYAPSTETGWVEHWVLFNGAVAQRWQKENLLPKQPHILLPGINEQLLSLFEELIELARVHHPYSNQSQAAVTMKIFAKILFLIQHRQDTSSGNNFSIIEKAKCYLHDHWNKQVDMKDLAESLDISYRHFRRLFKSSAGMPPQSYLSNLKIIQAKKLLEEPFAIKKIARMAGFKDPCHFSRLFKQKVGMSASQWRKQYKAG